jgi:hypothetical protein
MEPRSHKALLTATKRQNRLTSDFIILTIANRLAKVGDLWAGILDAKVDLEKALAKAAPVIEPHR